jgi:predicted PolB exonuclease-like 3'-5' exonuclease
MPFAIFDVETRVDKHLLNQVYFEGHGLSDSEAFERYREELRRRRDSDFLPITLHVPISIAIGNVGDDYVLRAVESLALDDYSEEKLVREFWNRYERFPGTLVSFNGRRFDIPVLELAALRHGIAAPIHFGEAGAARDRHSGERHFDLFDYLTNFGAISLAGGMDLLLKMIGMPGKTDMDGSMVQEYFEAGRLAEIHRYCRNDVAQTYFLFLRVALMRGEITDAAYHAAAEASLHFLLEEEPLAGKKIA